MLRTLRQLDIRRTVIASLFLPLLLFSFFSVGTMPVFSKQGVEIVICTGDSFKTITVDENGQPIEDENRLTCEWSLPFSKALLAAAPGEPAPVTFGERRILFPQNASFLTETHRSDIHARGPPSLPV